MVKDEQGLVLWTIYRRPRDYPRGFVVRRSQTGGRQCPQCVANVPHGTPAQPCGFADRLAISLDLARAAIPLGLARQPRHPLDDASIVEVWL